MSSAGNITGLLRSLLGPAIWFLCFAILYAIATAACARPVADGLYVVAAWTVVLASAAVLIWMMIWGAGNRRHAADGEFLTLLKRALTVLSLVGTLWLLIPLTLLPVCNG